MSKTDIDPELQRKLETVIAEHESGKTPGGSKSALSGWLNRPQPTGALPPPIGWSVPIEVEVEGPRGRGKAVIDLSFAADSWDDSPKIVDSLIAQGYPVKVWVPSNNNNNGGGRRWGNR